MIQQYERGWAKMASMEIKTTAKQKKKGGKKRHLDDPQDSWKKYSVDL